MANNNNADVAWNAFAEKIRNSMREKEVAQKWAAMAKTSAQKRRLQEKQRNLLARMRAL